MKKLIALLLLFLLCACNATRRSESTHFEVSAVNTQTADTFRGSLSANTLEQLAANLHISQTGDWWFRVYDTSQETKDGSKPLLAEGGGTSTTTHDASVSKGVCSDVNADVVSSSQTIESKKDSLCQHNASEKRYEPPGDMRWRTKAKILLIILLVFDAIFSRFNFTKYIISQIWTIIKNLFRRLQ